MEPEFLYRGYDCRKTLEQTMAPKWSKNGPESEAQFGDERVQCGDMDFTYGSNIVNTIHSHEYGGNGDPSPGISTTPNFEIARKYALGREKNLNGHVIKFSVSALKEAGVIILRVNEVLNCPSKPDDDEHWIYFQGSFPMEAIVEEIEVTH
ncbi:hypothetical protein [Leclercia adecarboxylata]|uniref:hypothetical protein n=1 Tax=Leclercia adecarboxylata TaxID=83655 RepID=UPI0011180C42|nr:hypothetical protein [Leclercia adecarboxylata]QCZ30185.1 hypothetical protein FHN83_26820 [Leclercia adecarboxylata]